VRCRNRASWQYCRPEGVTFAFQVIGHGVEPSVPNRPCNLFSKDDWRAALANEPEPRWPKVPIVGEAFALTRLAKRLARATAGPDFSIVSPSRQSQRVCPAAETSEEMALRITA